MKAYKLFRQRKNGTLGPLFIDRRLVIEPDTWLDAEKVVTKGYAVRPGWHCCSKKEAPHLSKEGRVWRIVEIDDVEVHERPHTQGGLWYVAQKMKVLHWSRFHV